MPLALIIEDSFNLAEVYADALQMIGFQTEIHTDGQSAIQAVDNGSPSLIVLDMNLPRISGHYLYRHIRGKDTLTQVPVVIATANNMIADTLRAELGPYDSVFIKPISINDLQKIAKDYLHTS